MKNQFQLAGNEAVIHVRYKDQVFQCVVDAEDLPRLRGEEWRMVPNGYVISRSGRAISRVIMNTPKGCVVDHIDHDLLNNRKANLRNVSQRMNLLNLATPAKNISFNPRNKLWSVFFSIDNKTYCYGSFRSKKEAVARAAEVRCQMLRGEKPVPPPFLGRSGKRNIYWHSQSRRWRARLTIAGKRVHLGNFHTVEDAERAVQEYAEQTHSHA